MGKKEDQEVIAKAVCIYRKLPLQTSKREKKKLTMKVCSSSVSDPTF